MTFNGKDIFGAQTRIQKSYRLRVMRETLPGVRGFRVYNLAGQNPDVFVWIVRGRLVAATLGALENGIDTNANMMDGRFYKFVTDSGKSYPNCQLVDYRQASDIKAGFVNAILIYTCEVSATIEQGSP